MPKITLRTLCLVTAVLCNVERSLEHEIPRRSFLSRRAIDGTRGRKYFDPNEEGAFDSYGSAGGQYDPYDHVTDLSDIRKNVPGEPGVDYPAYTTLPQTGFTCEGRSRGYYADEAAGCQVFHVCHDVLVSSFLCPIGSTFSQKLLTCDWWTKVDCSATGRYLGVNRGNSQVDDDEMIRNAYAMISLQSSAEDVTRDGLVDPDSGARIIDYSALGGRTVTGYTPGFRRITDYAAVEATGNDLPSGFDDYPHQNDRQILNYDRYDQRAKANPVYQGKLHFENKERSPYHASLIIRHDYQDRSGGNEFQDDYRRPDGLTNRLQTSYAPTVPTVTTTTRRFYSPTVPTTYRPSTLAYSKLDLMVESSDHLYAHSKSPATPPTITHQNDDVRNIDLRESEARYDGLKRSESVSSPRTDGDDKKDGDVRPKEDKTRLDFEEKSETSFRINVTDMIDEDEVFRQQNDRPVIKNDGDESLEDIETKDSIGIAQALNNPSGRIIIQSQNPVERVSKDERRGPTTPIPPQTILNHSSGSYERADSSQTPKRSDIFNETSNDRSTEDYEDVASTTTTSFEETAYTRSFGARTTPLLRDWRQKNIDAVQESTISITVKSAINTTGRSVDETHGEVTVISSSNDSRAAADQISSSTGSVSDFTDESVPRINLSFEVPQPALFLKPPFESFLINVPEDTRYTTIDENSKTSWNPETTTTEIPQFSSTNNPDQSPIYDENVEEQPLIDYTDEGLSETPNLGLHPTAQVVTEVSTPIPWFLSTWNDRSIEVPVTDIVPPIVDYNDGFVDFVPPNEHSYTAQFARTERVDPQKTQDASTTSKKNDSEAEVLVRYNTGFQFTIRDAIKAQQESKTNSKLPCSSSTSDRQGRLCETSSVAPKIAISTSSVEEKTISIDNEATTRIPEQSISLDNMRSPEKSVTLVPNESSTFTTQSPITITSNVDIEESNLKTVTPRGVLDIKDPEERTGKKIDTTVNNPLQSIRPGSLKHIEETIDKHNSPYQVSFTVKKDDDLETTADDFISRLISQHQRPLSVLNDEADNFEIIKSVEPETDIASILQVPKFADSNHASPGNTNDSFPTVVNDTTGQLKQPESNVSMLSLIQLMAELLKLDRLPRPFSVKDLHSVELRDSFHLEPDEPYVTTSPLLDYSQARTPFRNVNSKISTFDTLKTPVNIAEPKTLLNPGFNEPSFITANPSLDHSQVKTPFKNVNSKISVFDTLKTPVNIAEPRTLLNLGFNEPSFVTANPSLDHSQVKTLPFKNANSKVSAFDTLKISTSIVESETPQNLGLNEPSFVTINPSLDHLQIKTPFRNVNSKVSSFDNSLKISSNVAFKPSPDVSTRVNFNNATEEKTSRSKPESRTARPLQKDEILEQLTENFGQPLYRGDSIYRSLVFDLPQVQRSLDFETGLPIEESKHVEAEKEDLVSFTTRTTTTTTATTTPETTTTTESVRTIVETEFVPSLGFSFDTNEGREEYVQAILGGLIDEHTGKEGKNETSVAQLTDEAPKNETFRLEQHENSKDTKRLLTNVKN